MANQELSTKVITGLVRFSYAHVFKPKASIGGGEEKYSVSILIPKSDKATMAKINKAIEAAKTLGAKDLSDAKGRMPANLHLPVRDGDEERPDDPAYAGHYFINAYNTKRPGVVDADREEIIDEDEFYSGCYGRASINFYAYSRPNKGIAVSLRHLQKLKDGEPLGAGGSAADDFNDDFSVDDDLI